MRFDATTQTISWFQKEYREGTIALRPPYQRKPVWAARQKCYLIESILTGYPVPEIFIHETMDAEGRTTHAVVDGQQRIRTILQFLGLTTFGPDGKPETEEDEFVGFALDKLEQRDEPSPWFGMRFTDLAAEDRTKLFEYRMHIRNLYVSEESGEAELREMFRRLNRYLAPLRPQELRHATYTGPFAKLAETLADDEYWLESKLVSPALVRRLGDVEFVGQLLIGTIHGPQGGSQAVVDDFYRTYEDYDFEEGFPDQRRVLKLFNQTRDEIRAMFPDLGAGTSLRWANASDYYSLFVALAQVSSERGSLTASRLRELRDALTEFSNGVDRRVARADAKGPANVIAYARAIEKGANDKARRAERHRILVQLIEESLGVGSDGEAPKPRKRAAKSS
jgi:hypothetical protein